MTVCACVRECVIVRVGAPMHSLVPSVSCPSAGKVLALSYLFFFCLSLSLLLHVRLYADLMSICVCAGVFSGVCVCVCIQQRSAQGSNLVGGQACCETLRFSHIARCRPAGVYTRARSLSLRACLGRSVCLSVGEYPLVRVLLVHSTHFPPVTGRDVSRACVAPCVTWRV